MTDPCLILDSSSDLAAELAAEDEALCWPWPATCDLLQIAKMVPWPLHLWSVSRRGDRSAALWRRLVANRRVGTLVAARNLAVRDEEAILELTRLDTSHALGLALPKRVGTSVGVLASEPGVWSESVVDLLASYAVAHSARVALSTYRLLRRPLLDAGVSPALLGADIDAFETLLFPSRLGWTEWSSATTPPTPEFMRYTGGVSFPVLHSRDGDRSERDLQG